MSTLYERIEPLFQPDSKDPENSVLTQEEWDVYSLLSIAYNAYIRLPILFQGDQREFAYSINILKNIVMSRAAERELKAYYDQHDGPPIENI